MSGLALRHSSGIKIWDTKKRITHKELSEHRKGQIERAKSLPTEKDVKDILVYFEHCIEGINHLIKQESERILPTELLSRREEMLIALDNELRKAKMGKKVYEAELRRRQYMERIS